MSFDLTSPLFWILLGVFFLLVEITHFGFIFFFFGLGALVVALFSWLGIVNTLNPQLLLFLLSSLVSLYLFRNKLSHIFKGKISRKLKPDQTVDDIKGEKAVCTTRIEPGSLNGKVEYHGTIWKAQSEVIIESGSVVEIIERIDLTLKVKPVIGYTK
jgi:inner membrane protein